MPFVLKSPCCLNKLIQPLISEFVKCSKKMIQSATYKKTMLIMSYGLKFFFPLSVTVAVFPFGVSRVGCSKIPFKFVSRSLGEGESELVYIFNDPPCRLPLLGPVILTRILN